MKKDTRKFGISDKRGRQQSNMNPFMPQEGLKEPSLCTSCKTVYQHKHWAFDPEAYRKLKTDPKVNRISCPACQKIAAGYPEGIVTLSGSYLWKHEDEIQRILKNEEYKAFEKNQASQIEQISKLVQRSGKMNGMLVFLLVALVVSMVVMISILAGQ